MIFARTHGLSVLLVVGAIASLGCHQRLIRQGDPFQHGAFRVSADVWAGAAHSAQAEPVILRLGLDSVGHVEGTVTLADDYNESDLDLDSPDEGPGCTNRGVIDVVSNPQNPQRAEWFPHMLPGGGNAVVFRCPGLGLHKELTVFVLVSLQDPIGNSGWYMMRQQQPQCSAPGELSRRGAGDCPLLLGGKLTVARATLGEGSR